MPGGDASFVAPLHAVNVFVPLVDLTPANGPTEFTPGSHFDFDVEEASRSPNPNPNLNPHPNPNLNPHPNPNLNRNPQPYP